MATFSEIEQGVYRWDGVDADHGFPIVGYVVASGDGVVLIDPPGTTGSPEEIKALGKPQAILVTSMWHVRGSGKWKAELGIPIAAPASAASELAEAKTSADRELGEGDEYLGWKALLLAASEGERSYEELALWDAGRRIVVVGDLFAQAQDGGPAFGPTLFQQIPEAKMQPVLDRLIELDPRLILSGHLGPLRDVKEIFERLKSA